MVKFQPSSNTGPSKEDIKKSQLIVSSLKTKPTTKSDDLKVFRAKEMYKCRMNPLYFIYNYCYLDEGGGKLKYSKDLMHNKMRRVIRSIIRFHKCEMMASRQLGKSTIAACIIAWAMIFFPRNSAVILNMKQNAGKKNLKMVKFVIENCPTWMVTNKPFKQKGDIKTYLDLFNDSRVEVFYPL